MKIVLFILTALLQLCAAVPGLFMLLLGLNGYSERDATPALLAYVVLCGLGIVATSIGAVFTATKLEQRMGKWAAGALSFAGLTILGVGVIVVSWIIALFVAQIVRNAR